MNSNVFRSLTGLTATTAAVAALFAGSQSAHAQVPFTLNGTGTFTQQVAISTNSGASFDTTDSGPYKATINSIAGVPVYCIDATHHINYGGGYTADVSHAVTQGSAATTTGGYYNGGLASAIKSSDYGITATATQASARAGSVAWLTETYINANTSALFGNAYSVADNQAAISLALWDIIQDGGDGLATGTFRSNSAGNTSWGALVNSFETAANAHSNYSSNNVRWIQGPRDGSGGHGQDFVYLVSAVPEPSAFVTAFSLFGMTGMGLLRGRRKTAKATSTKA